MLASVALVQSEDTSIAGTAAIIAGQAKSLHAQLTRSNQPTVTGRDLAHVVELIELLATDMADLARQLGR